MRTALCLYGNVGGSDDSFEKGSVNDFEYCAKQIQNFIITNNKQVDVFIHSWSIKYKDKLIELYKPKLYLIEEQKKFSCHLNLGSNNLQDKASIEKIEESHKQFLVMHEFATKSRWYSNKCVLDLKREYEKLKNKRYKHVIVSRLDVVFNKPLNINKLSDDKFYAGIKNDQIEDYVFISNSILMDKFAEIYDRYDDLYEKHKITCPLIFSKQHIKSFSKITNLEYLLKCDLWRLWRKKHG